MDWSWNRGSLAFFFPIFYNCDRLSVNNKQNLSRKFFTKQFKHVLTYFIWSVRLPCNLSVCMLVSAYSYEASLLPVSLQASTIHLIRPAALTTPSSLRVLTGPHACIHVCMWCEWAIVRPPFSRVMISTPSPALCMSWWTDRPRTLGALWWSMCVHCGEKREKERQWLGNGVCVCPRACVFLFSPATPPDHTTWLQFVH